MGSLGVGMADEMHSWRRLVSTPTDSILRREEKDEFSSSLALTRFPVDFASSASCSGCRSTGQKLTLDPADILKAH